MIYAADDGGGGEIGVGRGGGVVEMVAIDEGVWCGETETGEDEPGRAVPDGDGVGDAEGPQPTSTPATTILAMNTIIAHLCALIDDAHFFVL